LRENGELKTATFTVSFQRAKRKDVFFSLKQGKLLVDIPEGVNFDDEKVQKACWNGISYFLKKEAKRILPDRVHELAQQFGFKYEDVKIQSSKTRWGSCSRRKNINLSFYLMLVPAKLADYVILHELCHTKEMNHGDKFWALMDRVTDGKAYDLRQALKKYPMPE
jgi:predicted metal-dependent hydrolase